MTSNSKYLNVSAKLNHDMSGKLRFFFIVSSNHYSSDLFILILCPTDVCYMMKVQVSVELAGPNTGPQVYGAPDL